MSRRLPAVAVALTLAIVVVACADAGEPEGSTTGAAAAPSASPEVSPALPPDPSPDPPQATPPATSPDPSAYGPLEIDLAGEGPHSGTMQGPDGPRTFNVRLPEGDVAGAPLVVSLHGYTQDSAGFEAYTRLAAAATGRGVVTVTPDGFGKSWNGGMSCCPPATRRDIDDVGFLDALAGELTAELELDPDRTWAVGFSNGGFMALRLACEGDGTFDAVVSHAGTMDRECAPAGPTSVLLSHGDRDPVIPFEDGRGPVSPQAEGRGARQVFDAWRAIDGCPDPERRGSLAEEELLAAPCEDDTAVGLAVWAGVGHAWPADLNDLLLDWLAEDAERRSG